jgi:hypothetical protein
MTEPNSAEAAPIEDGDSLNLEDPKEKNTDNPEAAVDENDRVEDFPAAVPGWPDDPPKFEDVAFPPQPDEGVS